MPLLAVFLNSGDGYTLYLRLFLSADFAAFITVVGGKASWLQVSGGKTLPFLLTCDKTKWFSKVIINLGSDLMPAAH